MKKLIFLIILQLFNIGFSLAYAEDKDVRQPAVAGQFYPSNPNELSSYIDKLLQNVEDQSKILGKSQILAILVPHAGYVYSAQIAAYSYKLLINSDIDTVILIGNSHNFPLKRGAVDLNKIFLTPLGEVPVNRDIAKDILKKTQVLEENNYAHIPEHSLEVQIPFLQKVLKKNFSIVPVLLGQISLDECKQIGKAIADTIRERKLIGKTVIVISSDMSHFPSWANANLVDSATLKSLEKFDPKTLQETIGTYENSETPNLQCVLCGKESVYTGMYAAKELGADKAVVLKYSNSGNVSGDKSRVVGYGTAIFTKPLDKIKSGENPIKQSKEKTMSDFTISEKNQKELLNLARQSIENYLKNGKRTEFKTDDKQLLSNSAVFVTLTKNHNLRGCIGTTSAHLPLYKVVSEYAIAAAEEDPRFNPVTEDELKDIKIEISVLSPMQKIQNHDEIKPNINGVLIKRGLRSGLFLPQVWEQLPSKEEFMNELCWQKAGLEPDAWKKGNVDIYTFTVFAFEEK
ncbi:MAG: AmmeMemoRadiSam system protein B [Elusimicrobia bacterium]|nr:AmmeMemoRadiSam system protein B [Elusimicrobiota bacterium]